MASAKRNRKSAKGRPERFSARLLRGRGRSRLWAWVAVGSIAAAVIAGGIWWAASAGGVTGTQAPEAEKVLKVQSTTPFQIMIPGYLPREFDREDVALKRHDAGPAGEPLVELTYRTNKDDGPTIYVREWVPGNPELESLAGSKPIETKWGKGWLLEHKGLTAIWADVGATRVSVFTADVEDITREQLLGIAESLGPASNKQVFTYIVDKPVVKDMEPPKPFEVPVGADGVQAVTLVITPGGYDPIRFAVTKDVPVRLTFRELGEVGCGNELIFPSDPENPTALRLDKPTDVEVFEFTPKKAGEFQFYCGHRMYRGLFTVKE